MILYQCDLCKKVVSENETTTITIGNALSKDRWDICLACANDLKDKLNKITGNMKVENNV